MMRKTPLSVRIEKPGRAIGEVMNEIRSWLDNHKIQPADFKSDADPTQIMRGFHRFFVGQRIDLKLEILGQQFAQEDGLVEKACRENTFAEDWRQVPSTGHDAHRVVSRHRLVASAGCSGPDSLLDVNQA